MYRPFAAASLAFIAAISPGISAECSGNRATLGTSRIMTVDPAKMPRVGTMQYPDSLPLLDHELVITFDDGPLPPSTAQVLDALRAECVRATFFVVGSMAKAHSNVLRRTLSEGHTIATHSNSHRVLGQEIDDADAERDFETGVAMVEAALGDGAAVAPFYRFPGFGRSAVVEQYLAARDVMTWSADLEGDDWTGISAEQIVARVMSRLKRKGRGILVLHDIQPKTARALPRLLNELRENNFKIVHVVPVAPGVSLRHSEH